MKTKNIYEENIQSLIQTAVEKHQSGQWDEAKELYNQILQIKAESASEQENLEHDYYSIVSSNLGNIFEKKGQLEAAVEFYQQALMFKPDYAEAYYNLGNVFHQQGNLEKAINSYEQALNFQPDIAEAHNNLGIIFHQQNKLDKAINSYKKALGIKPDYARSHYNLANIFLQQNKLEAALKAYQEALKFKPDYAGAYHNLGNIFKLQGKLNEAVKNYQQAIKFNSNCVEFYQNLGNAFYEQGNLEKAIESYQKVLNINPDFAPAKFGVTIAQLPIIASSFTEIGIQRNTYQKLLEDLAQSYKQANPEELVKAVDAVGTLQPFYLAYQGCNDRDLQQTYGEMIVKIMSSCYPQYSQKIALPNLQANEKIRVGFVSRFFYNHSNWKIPIKGWVENLDKREFELFGYHTDTKVDDETLRAAQVFDKFTQGQLQLSEWCELIKKDNLHILIFPEFGMDPMTVKLGCLRLAPIQITSWGHPETSGLPTIDYYLSSELMEPENAGEHYTEKLVKLPNLSIHYTPLAVQPQLVSKSEIGIKDNEIMFWCCQSLFKYLPQHDDVFPLIAKDLGSCKFVFIQYDKCEIVQEIFEQRLSRAFEEFGLNYQDYCLFLPRLDNARFAGMADIADVFLDSIGWSGCNSTLEAIAQNTPVITLKGDLMRGRHSMAMLLLMDIEETIAATKEEYVKLAVRLGQDAEYRQKISQLVAENKYKLYNDLKPVRALSEFFLNAVGRKSRIAQLKDDNAVDTDVQALINAADEKQQLDKIAYYQQAIAIKPDFVEAHQNLAELLRQQGRLNDAIHSYQRAIEIKPDYVAYHNLGYVLDQKGLLEQAMSAYQKALQFEDNPITHNNLGNIYKKINQFDAAVESYQKAIKINPNNPNIDEIYYNLGVVFREQNKLDAAVEAFEQAVKLAPTNDLAKFGICLGQLPIIYQSVREIERRRKQYENHLLSLASSYNKANQEERAKAAKAIGSSQPFYLAYQGLNDRNLQQIYGEMICQLMASRYPQWCKPFEGMPQLAANEKIRVGFVSKYFFKHSVWKIPMKGWVENLDRSEFELFGYHTGIERDEETTKAAKAFDKFIQGPLPLEQWAEIIQQDKLHVLIFPEFGMDTATVPIGCLKLAPIQVAFGGHPETSGLPTIDYHLSSDLMEPENAQEHYTEQLVRLPNLAIHYTPLAIQPQQMSKRDIGIADEEIMFWSCQSLFKYIPQHDDVFPLIAIELTNAKFVFIQHRSEYVTEIFRQRLKQAFDEFGLNYLDYCILLPRLNSKEFASTAAIADVFLDNIGWSGNNTAMESSAYDVPIVTCPGEMMRSRHGMAILKMMGIEETIAATKEDYVRIAVRLGFDAEYRQYISRLIAQNKHKLYHDLKPVRALEDFLLQAVGTTRKSVTPEIADTLQLAIQEQRNNNLDKAKLAYQQVLAMQPNHPEALYGLGTLAQQVGELLEAEQFLSAAARVQPDSLKVWFSLGNLYQVQGKLPQAEAIYKQAIALRPDAVSIYNNLGYNLQQQGKLDKAITYYQKALELQPNCIEAKINLGNVLHSQGKLSLEEEVYYATLNNQLGIKRKNAGDFDNAVTYYQQAIAIKADFVEAHNNLAEVLHQQGRLDDAIYSYRRAIEIKPNYVAYHNLGNILDQKGLLVEAIEAYQQALKCEDNLITHNNLGNIYKTLHEFDAAAESYQKAIKINPNIDDIYYNLGTTFREQNKLDAALEAFEQALKLTPTNDFAKFGICLGQLPVIYHSADEIELRRNQYEKHLLSLATSYNKANQESRASSAEAIGSLQPFYLAYQGLNDRNLQQIYGEMICQLMTSRYPQWCQPYETIPQLAASEKIRIGFVSRCFYNHSNWKIAIKGWVENLDRGEFELFGYHTSIERDKETAKAAKVFDKFTQGRLLLEQWCELIQKDNLHILIFPELGMDPMTLQLGCLRLAPIQVTSWGHPNTSGLPTIDYYLSSDLMEPENAQEHYTEKLIRLPNISIHYTPLAIELKAKTKEEIGIKQEEIMFWCCQSLFKYLPQHDDVFPRISQELPNAKFVFIQHKSEYVTDVFRQRLSSTFEEFGLNYQDFCIFLPRLDVKEFASTTAIADVFLDSIGWSGCNSTLEAIAHNIPVVTIESELMRGRHGMAILKMMGIEETIATSKEDYVKIAIRLGTDSQYRQHISRQVAQNKQKLYGDLKPVRALEDFFFKVVNKSRRFDMVEATQTMQVAAQYQRVNRLVEAQQLYQQVLEKYPHHPEALYNLGMLAAQLDQPQTALTYLIAATQVQPDVKTWFSLGNLYLGQQQYSEAVAAYRQALALRPDSLAIYNNLGYALQQQGLFDEAVDCYQKALEIKPDFAEAQANLGNALHALNKLSSSKQLYYAQLNLKLGRQRKKAGDLKTAVAYYKQAIALQPDMVEAYYELGASQQAQGELEEAMLCYRRTLELKSDYAEAYFNLAQIYQQQNNLEKAISTYRQGLKLINSYYAKAVESDQTSKIDRELPVTPPIPQKTVQIGNNQFPGIGPVQSEQGQRPFWSVVIPVYATENRRQYLLQCLASVLRQWQGHQEMEIVLVDNASEPPLYDLVNAIGGGIIRYYRNPQNVGTCPNHNIAVALSRGQWTHVLHDDDYVLPGFYDRLKQSLEGCPESIGAAFTGYENINETGKVVFTQQVYGKHRGIARDFLQRIGVSNPLNMPAVVISRKVYEHLGGYSPELKYTLDWEFYKRIAAFYDWWCEPEILVHYREHPDNLTTELMLSGSKGTCLRRAIEISDDYIPQEITAKSRSYHFNYCLSEVAIPLKFGKVDGALRMVKEALKIDRSTEAVTKLFAWLKQDEAKLLRNEIASKLISKTLA